MSLHGYTKDRVRFVDRKAGVEEYEGRFQGDKKVVIRTEERQSSEECSAAISAALSLASLKHPHVLRLYDCFLEPTPANRWRVVLITERCDSRIDREIARRSSTAESWTDEELCSVLYTLGTALSYAESRGIAHPHISPRCVYLSQGVYKLGDFQPTSALPSAGAALYLSPEARVAMAQALRHSGSPPAQFDPYKSSVFSLAVTLAAMALLKPPWKFGEILTKREAVDQVVGEVKATHPGLSEMLKDMMQWDAGVRLTVSGVVAMEALQQEEPAHKLQIEIPESPMCANMHLLRHSLITPQGRVLANSPNPFGCAETLEPGVFSRLYSFQTTDSYVEEGAGWAYCVVCGGYFDKRNGRGWVDLSMPEVCSEACLNNYRQAPKAMIKFCSVCSRKFPGTTPNALTLPCGDVICSIYCLSHYCQSRNILRFFLSGAWECIKCKQTKNYAMLFGGKKFIFSEYVNRLCQKCWTNNSEIVIPKCGHRCCGKCTKQFLVIFCPICTNYG